MIRFEIDGMKVNLNDGASLSYVEYNSLADAAENKGGFTLDIDIDLRDADNARAFSALNRINSVNRFRERTAKLWVDNLLLLSGVEKIIKVDRHFAKIQVLTGNSQVNFVGNNTRIEDLELGEVPEIDAEEATLSLQQGKDGWVCCPVMVKKDEFPTHNDVSSKFVNQVEYQKLWGGMKSTGEDFIPQLFIVPVIEKVFAAIGWTVSENTLRDDSFAKNMIIVHGRKSKKINEILPNWTVNKFLEEVQKLFNVIFVADQTSKKVNIYNVDFYYKNMADTFIIPFSKIVIDENSPSHNYEGNGAFSMNYDAVEYDFPSVSYYNRANIKEEVMALTRTEEIHSISQINQANFEFRKSEYYNKPIVVEEGTNSTQYVLRHDCDLGNTSRYMARVNQFKRAYSDKYEEGAQTTKFDIMPAQTFVLSIYLTNSEFDGASFMGGGVIPYAENNDYEAGDDEETNEANGLNEWIDNGAPPKRDTSNDKIFVAQYMGMAPCVATAHDTEKYFFAKFPSCFTHRFMNCVLQSAYNATWQTSYIPYVLDVLWSRETLEGGMTFDLKWNIRRRYSNDIHVDLKDEIEIILLNDGRKYDTNAIYIINNRKMIARKFEYKVDKNKLAAYVIGTFMPYN